MKHRSSRQSGIRGPLVSVAATLLLAGGVATVGVGLQSEASAGPAAFQSTVEPSTPPTVTPRQIVPSPPVQAGPEAPDTSKALIGPVLPASEPASVAIDIIGVDSSLMSLGKEPDGTVAVPPGNAGSPAGWYKNSPTPGELGSSVILGHVNSVQTGIGVFYRLHELQDADQISVTRADGTVAVFEVYRVDTYDKKNFPTAKVYGNAGRAELRLVTCGGYEPSTGEFNQNTVAYAYLISSHPA